MARREDEPQSEPERQGLPGKSPGKVQRGEEPRQPPVHEPGKTPDAAQGPDVSTDAVPGERSPDPNRLS